MLTAAAAGVEREPMSPTRNVYLTDNILVGFVIYAVMVRR